MEEGNPFMKKDVSPWLWWSCASLEIFEQGPSAVEEERNPLMKKDVSLWLIEKHVTLRLIKERCLTVVVVVVRLTGDIRTGPLVGSGGGESVEVFDYWAG